MYLARQIQDSARAARSAAVTDATNAIQSLYQELGTNSQSSQRFLKGLTDYKSMSEQEQFQWLMMMHSWFIAFQRSFFLSQEGTLDVGLRDSIGTAIIAVNYLPGLKYYWEQRRFFSNRSLSIGRKACLNANRLPICIPTTDALVPRRPSAIQQNCWQGQIVISITICCPAFGTTRLSEYYHHANQLDDPTSNWHDAFPPVRPWIRCVRDRSARETQALCTH